MTSSLNPNPQINMPSILLTNEIQFPVKPSTQIISIREILRKISSKNISLPEMNQRLIILDLVTTGEDPSKNNIIEIGCYEMIDGCVTGRQFRGFLHPRYDIDEYIEEKIKNNIYMDFTKDEKEYDCIVLENFLNFVNGSKIVVHNMNLNMTFLNNELIYHKKDIIPRENFFCTLEIFKQMFPEINTEVKMNDLIIFSEQNIPQNKKYKIKISKNICSLIKCCEYLKIKIMKKSYFSAKFNSLLICKLLAKYFYIFEEVKKLRLKIKEKLKEKKSNEDNKINVNITKTENRKINRSIYQDIYSDINKNKEEKKSENIIQLIEEDYKNSDYSYYKQFKTNKVNNELINIINNHNMEMSKIKNGQRINGIDLNNLNLRNKRKKYMYKYNTNKNNKIYLNNLIKNNEIFLLGQKRDLNYEEEKSN